MKKIVWMICVLTPTLFWGCLLIVGIEWSLSTRIMILLGFFVYGTAGWLIE